MKSGKKIFVFESLVFIMKEALYFNVYHSIFSGPEGLSKFKDLVEDYGIKTVVETGTFKGDSTVVLAEFVDNVISIEINPEYFEEAKKRMVEEWEYEQKKEDVTENEAHFSKGDRNIFLFLGSSPEVISRLIHYLKEPTCFYLDAHWTNYWPIKEEIRAIKPRPNSVIIIHDIEVPGKNYGAEWYASTYFEGDGEIKQDVTLNYDLIKDDLEYVNPNFKISYNDKEQENPEVRGVLYAVP